MSIVVIIDTDNKTYYSHRVCEDKSQASAYAEGMAAAWEISHGYCNCWQPYVLDNPEDFQEWKDMGFPGKDKLPLRKK